MKGLIFNVVQEVVEDRFGPEVWDEAVERSGVDGAFTSLGSYADDDLVALVGAIAEVARVPTADVLVLAGRHGFARLAGRHPELLVDMHDWRDVLSGLDGIIHPEVLKIYPDATVPSFSVGAVEGAASGPLVVEYRSDRHLCLLAEGLILGLGDWFERQLAVEHRSCVHRGDEICVIEVDDA